MPDKKKFKSARPKARLWVRIVKALLLTLWGAALFVIGTLICALTVLTPERLTPLVETIATTQLQNARVEVGNISLTASKTFPFLQAEISDLKVISHAIDSLAPDAARRKPQWADTALTVDAFTGGLNLPKLMTGTLEFSDVTITRPAVNFVVANEKVTNFSIMPPSEEKEEEPFSLPNIRIKRFTVNAPCPVRYHDISTGTDLTVRFNEAWIDGHKEPVYKLALSGDMSSDMLLRYWILPQIAFGLSGDIEWDQKAPARVSLDNLSMNLDIIEAKASAAVDFTEGVRIDKLDFDLLPVDIGRVLKLLPVDFKKEYGIPEGIRTNATVAIRFALTQPFLVGGRSALPHCTVHLVIPDSEFRWQKVNFDNLAADLSLDVPGDDINRITVTLNRLNMRGPATDLTVTGKVSSLMADPQFEGTLKGVCRMEKLPPIITNAIPGTIRGRLTADATIKGRPSMLSFERYHNLKVDGLIKIDQLYYVGADTALMVRANHASFDFGTNRSVTVGEHHADSLLQAKIQVDSLAVLHDDISLKFSDIKFGLGAVNRSTNAKKTDNRRHIIPMGGGLSIGSFRLLVLTDSIMTNLRGIHGMASVSAHNDDPHTPEFIFNLGIDRFSAGGRTDRIMFRNAQAKFSAWPEPQTRRASAIKHISDSLARRHPDIPLDSIYVLALQVHQEHAKHHRYPRVHPRETVDSTEFVDFGIATGLQRMLTEWRFNGSLTADRAGIFTPYFPVRNRFRNINLAFDNDSIVMRDIRYKCGRSDFTVTGIISNLRRGLTSRRGRQPLKINLDLESDTVDINQLAQSLFAGSAYHQKRAEIDDQFSLGSENLDEGTLDQRIGKHVQDAPDSMAPFLIPINIEASVDVKAENVLYSDLLLHKMHGRAITYNGALSISDLSAKSGIGDVTLQALYMGRQVDSLQFGFGLQAKNFNIHKFLDLVPAVDTIMPLLRDFEGIITGDIAATTDITPNMDFDMSTLRAAIRLSGDTLVLLDPDTFKSLSKWLLFKDKKKNFIDHMSVQMLIEGGKMQLFPFIFNIDRYRLGVQGSNDFNLNFNYHIAVLKSPIPFKFGINIKGTPDDFKIRLGGAKFDDKTPISVDIVDDTRVNLVNGLRGIFRRGLRDARFSKLKVDGVTEAAAIDLAEDSLTHADSLQFIREGLIAPPDTTAAPVEKQHGKKGRKGKDKKAAVMLTLPAPLTLFAVLRRRKEDEL